MALISATGNPIHSPLHVWF